MVMRLLVLASVLLLVACQSQPTYMPSGEQTYKQYCAACHGADAKGHGPVASVLTTPPPDLTTLVSCPGDFVSGAPPPTARLTLDLADWLGLSRVDYCFHYHRDSSLAKSHSGKFPYDYVSSVLEFGTASSRNIVSDYAYPAHSSSDMPTWGPIFQYYDKQSERVVQQRIKNLCDYLASLQEI